MNAIRLRRGAKRRQSAVIGRKQQQRPSMADDILTPYDEVDYPSFPIYFTHPDRLATMATLFGMKPAPPQKCRFLELGCFDGVNLAAMAVALPDSEFVGVDIAGTAIARGKAL